MRRSGVPGWAFSGSPRVATGVTPSSQPLLLSMSLISSLDPDKHQPELSSLGQSSVGKVTEKKLQQLGVYFKKTGQFSEERGRSAKPISVRNKRNGQR